MPVKEQPRVQKHQNTPWPWLWVQGWLDWVAHILYQIQVWGTFAVPDDPSRSGAAPIPVSGINRLVIESAVFAFAIWTLYDLGYIPLSRNLSIIVTAHYVASYDRILWLFRI